MVRLHLQWLDWLRHRPAGERYAMPCVWGRAFPDWTLPPLDLRKDDLWRSDKVGEGRCFCAPARHSRKACHPGPSWRFICTLEHLTNRLARVSNDYAPDRRAAKRPDELELVIFAAVLLESSVEPILPALAHAPIHLSERQLISTSRWNKLSAHLAPGDRTPEGR
jgi:hypothetical protein